MDLNRDFSELLSSFNEAGVRYLVVGAYAVAHHGDPRYTKDLDIWVEPTQVNGARVWKALCAYQAPMTGIRPEDLSSQGTIFQLGVEPIRIDIITSVEGLDFAAAWKNRVQTRFGRVPVNVIGQADLISNKQTVGRPQDLLDVARIERLARHRPKMKKK